jgi:hypothetical protein
VRLSRSHALVRFDLTRPDGRKSHPRAVWSHASVRVDLTPWCGLTSRNAMPYRPRPRSARVHIPVRVDLTPWCGLTSQHSAVDDHTRVRFDHASRCGMTTGRCAVWRHIPCALARSDHTIASGVRNTLEHTTAQKAHRPQIGEPSASYRRPGYISEAVHTRASRHDQCRGNRKFQQLWPAGEIHVKKTFPAS